MLLPKSSLMGAYLSASLRARRKLPTFGEFWDSVKSVLVISLGALILGCLLFLFLFDVKYFYGNLSYDALLYHLRGWYLLHYNSTATRLADNLPPYQYVSLPGFLRIPFLLFTDNFDIQLRCIQVGNIFLLGCIGIQYSYILYIFLPKLWRNASIPFVFAVILLSGHWHENLLLPLGDLFFSLFMCSAMLLIRSIKNFDDDDLLWRKVVIIILLVLCATLTKFTGVFLVAYALLCWFPLLKFRTSKIVVWFGSGFLTIIVFLFLSKLIPVFTYAVTGLERMKKTYPHDWILNLIGISLPAQIIPNYRYLYSSLLTQGFLYFDWLSSTRNMLVLGLGTSISVVIAVGVWRCRRVLFPEIIFLMLCLPLIVPITTSTTRYLIPFQALIMVFFYCGCRRLSPNIFTPIGRKFKIVLMVSIASILMIGFFRVFESAQNYSSNLYLVMKNVAVTYQQLDAFLGKLDKRTTRLIFIGNNPGEGKWQPIHGLHYVAPDNHLGNIARNYDVYVVFDQNLKFTNNYKEVENSALNSLSQWGKFDSTLVLDSSNKYAWGRIYRISVIN